MRYTTKRNGKNVIHLLNSVCGIDMPYWRIDRADDLHSYLSGDAADTLAAYEDAEEQGRLVILPCKVGTVIWRVWNGKIGRYVVVEVDAQDHVKLRFLIECLPYLRFYWDDEYGKTVFCTREEAKAALKGLKGENGDV